LPLRYNSISFRLQFFTLSLPLIINSLIHYAKGTLLLFKNKLQLLVSTKFQYLFQFIYIYFTIPSRYLSAIHHQKFLSFEGGSPLFKQYMTGFILLYKLKNNKLYNMYSTKQDFYNITFSGKIFKYYT